MINNHLPNKDTVNGGLFLMSEVKNSSKRKLKWKPALWFKVYNTNAAQWIFIVTVSPIPVPPTIPCKDHFWYLFESKMPKEVWNTLRIL